MPAAEASTAMTPAPPIFFFKSKNGANLCILANLGSGFEGIQRHDFFIIICEQEGVVCFCFVLVHFFFFWGGGGC